MKKENQNIEWKQIWKDDYLKWICAFANSTGGLLYIGLNDDGKVVGVKNAKDLVYEIPHKTKDYLGILVQTSIKRKKNLEYIVIKVEAHPYPISLRGRYYIRSGSNTYEAVGMELDRLMLKKQGIRWEKLPGHKSTIQDLDSYAIEYYKNIALSNKSLNEQEIKVDTETLLKNLRLHNGRELSLAALLLFGRDTENWVYNSFVKICELDNHNNIIQKDKITGSLITQLELTIELLRKKYKVFTNYEINEKMLREIITNAIIHKAYDTQVPIEISVYKNKLIIYNSSEFPKDITSNTIYNPHPSIPYNPRIANAFYKCGLASLWGLGTEKIKEESKTKKLELPKYRIGTSGVTIRINAKKEKLKKLRQELLVEIPKDKLLDLLIKREDITEEEIKRILSLKKKI